LARGKVPFTKDFELFKKLGEIGKRLMDLHLMKSDECKNMKREKSSLCQQDSIL
jgi:hypothetical protein